MKRRSRPNWSSLPEDVLGIIAKSLSLGSHVDLLRFRAVCRSFRSSSSTFYPPKTLIPRSSFRIYFSIDSTPGNGSNFMLTKSTIYAIHPLHRISDTPEPTWMVRIEESSPGKVRINDPLGGFRFKNLSSELPKSLNLLDYRVKEITTAYRLELANELHSTVPELFRKVVVSECVDGFAVMALHRFTGKLVVWRNGDEKWINLDTNFNRFRDVVFHNEKFYALRSSGLTIAVDYKSLNIAQVANAIQDTNFQSVYLVKSSVDLFSISKFGRSWKVHKLDEEKREWFPVMHELEDRVLFAGNGCSFSLPANELPGCEGNRVYISYESGMGYENDCPGMHTWIFDLDYNAVQAVLSRIFWPPPTWIE